MMYTYNQHYLLQDLSKYQNDELLHEALHLLNRFYSAEEHLFEKAVQAQVIISLHIVNTHKLIVHFFSY